MTRYLLLTIPFVLVACGQEPAPAPESAPKPTASEVPVAPASKDSRLDFVLASQPEESKARYGFRHPKETLEFFGIEPGTTVVEALPGGGWYTKILLHHLGSEGALFGADYPMEMWPKFGFFSDEQIEEKKTWVTDWTAEAEGWRGPDSARVSAFVLGSMPGSLTGKADAVLFVRALHNLSRFENDGGFLTAALADAFAALKPGGIVGVVQHSAPDTMPDERADGSQGYMKRDVLVGQMEAAGFEFVASSDINANPADKPTEDDIVWRLPPSLATSAEDPELRERLTAIGESNRMTLKFRKPM